MESQVFLNLRNKNTGRKLDFKISLLLTNGKTHAGLVKTRSTFSNTLSMLLCLSAHCIEKMELPGDIPEHLY